jgi:peptide chain release factor
MISRDRVSTVEARLARLGVDWADIREEFIRGSGAGGQKINKTSSTVRLFHEPSGVEVRCQEERSQAQNRILARERLADILESRKSQSAQQERQAREKVKRQNRQRSRNQKARMVEDKRRRSLVKSTRRYAGDE